MSNSIKYGKRGVKKMEPLISVIVPVYKVEDFLDHCLRSITSQTYKNIEIILVDDGSPDRCPQMCDSWKKIDNRIKVIHQNNYGGGQARNRALDIAEGEFIVFVDSDDYIASTMLEFLYNQFKEDVDIVECGYCVTENDDVLFDDENITYECKVFNTEEAMRENIRDQIFRQLIWNKMYRKNTIGNIRFPIESKIDDEFWTYRVLGNARRLIYTNKVLYAYRQQENSVMHLLSPERRLQSIEAKIQRHNYIIKYMPNLEVESLSNLWFTCIYQGQLVMRSMNKKDYQCIWKRLKQIMQLHSIKGYLSQISGKPKLWLKMASVSFYWTCKSRNILKIGL